MPQDSIPSHSPFLVTIYQTALIGIATYYGLLAGSEALDMAHLLTALLLQDVAQIPPSVGPMLLPAVTSVLDLEDADPYPCFPSALQSNAASTSTSTSHRGRQSFSVGQQQLAAGLRLLSNVVHRLCAEVNMQPAVSVLPTDDDFVDKLDQAIVNCLTRFSNHRPTGMLIVSAAVHANFLRDHPLINLDAADARQGFQTGNQICSKPFFSSATACCSSAGSIADMYRVLG